MSQSILQFLNIILIQLKLAQWKSLNKLSPWFKALYSLGALFFLGTSTSLGYFNSTNEFPNYFVPSQYRQMNPLHIPDSVVQESKDLIEKALTSINNRLLVPLVLEGEIKAKPVYYFEYVKENLKKIDPSVRILPSGGVIRSELTYIYQLLKEGEEGNPKKDWRTTLREIADSKEGIPASVIRGVGGDFDVLLDSAQKFSQLRIELLRITNSAETTYGFTNSQNATKRLFFTIGDSKDYSIQTHRASEQGGSTIDLLAFDIESGKLLDPKLIPNVTNNFIRGILDYVAPLDTKIQAGEGDTAKQTIRGIRSLLELPWLRLMKEQQLKSELTHLRDQLNKGIIPSEKALDQFNKMLRNARYSGAHNRFLRGAPGSIEQIVQEIVTLINFKKSINYLPEFVGSTSITKRIGDNSELNGLPRNLLMGKEEFFNSYTNNGTLYHGTPSITNAMAIMRQGLFVSKMGQGTAAYGRGAYSSPHFNTAASIAGSSGIVLDLKLKPSAHIHILNWNSQTQNDPFIQKVIKEAKENGKETFELLSRKYAVDIIVNGHVLIQNSDIIEYPKGFGQILKGLINQLGNDNINIESRMKSFNETLKLSEFIADLGEEVPELNPKIIENLLEKGLHSQLVDVRVEAINNLRNFVAPDKILALLLEAGSFFDPHDRVRTASYNLLERLINEGTPLIPEIMATLLEKGLHSQFANIRVEAINKLSMFVASDKILSLLVEADSFFVPQDRERQASYNLLERMTNEGVPLRLEILETLFEKGLQSQNVSVREEVINNLNMFVAPDKILVFLAEVGSFFDPYDRVRKAAYNLKQKTESESLNVNQCMSVLQK